MAQYNVQIGGVAGLALMVGAFAAAAL